MDAPLYPPAVAYEQPLAIPCQWTTANLALADLVTVPEFMEILQQEIPGSTPRIERSAKHPILANFTPRALVAFGMFKGDALDRVDQRLRALAPRVLWR